MQKNRFVTVLFLFFLFAVTSCKKNGSNNTTTAQGDYQPMGSGSEWNYSITGTTTASFKLTATTTDTLVNGKSYKIFTNSAGANEYYNKTGGDYNRYAKLGELNNQVVELLYLKDNVNKGTTWVETKTVNIFVTGIGTVPVTAMFTFTVAEKGIEYIVNGVTFKDVIKITAVPSFTASGSTIPIGPYDLQYFYAKKTGLIYSKVVLSIPLASVNVNTETKINSFTIR